MYQETLSQDSTNLTAMQLDIENVMADEAVKRQRKDNEGSTIREDWSGTKAGRYYVSSFLNSKDTDEHRSYLSHIKAFIEPKKGAGRHHVAAKLLRATGVGAEEITFLALKAIINALSIYRPGASQLRLKRSSMCARVADMVHDEWRVLVFADTDFRKKLVAKLLKDFDKRAYPREWRKRTIRNYFYSEQVEWSGWSQRERMVIGYALIYLFKEATGLIEFKDNNSHVEATPEFVDHMNKLATAQVVDYMIYKPMVVRPRPWTQGNLFKGGYLSRKVRPYPIVKGARKRDRNRLMDLDLSKVLPAVNALQDTPWRVNREMLEALRWAYHVHGGNIRNAKLPRNGKEPLPVIPPGYGEDEEITKAHNLAVFKVHDRRRRDKSKQIAAGATISIADQYKGFEEIYFPHNLDSRGRAYPLPAILNPQGSDYQKAMLEFAKGCPAGDASSRRWIAIACANAYGNDKVSLQERMQWTLDNEDMLLSIAADYTTDLRWMQAGEPFQFLRSCFEWRDLKTYGDDFVSHMVIPVDATNSGLQHYSAMLRDESAGFYVNLVPGHARQDIYGKVADETIHLLMQEEPKVVTIQTKDKKTKEVLSEAEVEIHPKHLLGLGIDRKATKRQVMVVPYAGKFMSCLGYTREWLKEKHEAGHPPAWDVDNFELNNAYVNMLAKPIWNAIDTTVVKGKQAMLWLSEVAKEYSNAMNDKDVPIYERRMSWKTPDGFEVIHLREDTKEQRIKTSLDGQVFLTFYEDTGFLDPRDMALAVAPNFVHALDATHLRATTIMGLEKGITSFGMIHDSFGVHAGKMSMFLAECVKPAFVAMYENDVLEDFAEQFRSVCNVPPVPEKGQLDLQGVLQSEFFFS